MTSKPAKRQSRKLSQRLIVERALELTRQQGVDFSMRDLGKDLDVWPMAIYRHYENREALMGDVINAIMAEVLNEEALRSIRDRRTSWRSRAMRFCLHCYDVIVRYPGSAQIIVAGTTFSPNRLRLTDVIVEFLVDLGLSHRRSAEILHSMSLMLFQAATLDQARQDGTASLAMVEAETLEPDSPVFHPDVLNVYLDTSLRERAARGLDIIFDAIEFELRVRPEP